MVMSLESDQDFLSNRSLNTNKIFIMTSILIPPWTQFEDVWLCTEREENERHDESEL